MFSHVVWKPCSFAIACPPGARAGSLVRSRLDDGGAEGTTSGLEPLEHPSRDLELSFGWQNGEGS
jgi:hypothetical protein